MRILRLASFFVLVGMVVARAYPQYYNIANRDQAQAEAQDRHLPLAWYGGAPDDLNPPPLPPDQQYTDDSKAVMDLAQMAMSQLQNQAVVIFYDGRNMGPVPAIVHAQDHIADDGPLPGGASWLTPKIVFTNPQVTRILGRVSHTQMKADGEMSIRSVLQKIGQDPAALAPDPLPTTVAPPDLSPTAISSPASSPNDTPIASNVPPGSLSPTYGNEAERERDGDMSPDELEVWNWFRQNGVYAAIGVAVLLVVLLVASRPAE